MTYTLGLDLGTTFTAAAVARGDRVEMMGLGLHGPVIPSVVHLREDNELLTGDAAARRGLVDPTRTAREFKRRLGDPTPILLGGTPFAAQTLMAALVRDVVSTATEREGAAPDAVALTHPANWGEFKLELLRQAAESADLHDVTLVPEPVAAAAHYATEERVPAGASVAVYDLGGGTFDVVVLRRTEDGFSILGTPEGLERLGGIDFDHAVMSHVERSMADEFACLERTDPDVVTGLARLRQDCVLAKEGLSVDSEVTIPVNLPGIRSDVRMTRSEFESLIEPTLAEPLRAVRRALDSADVTADELHSVLLVGGSSRVPLVGETVANSLGRRVALDSHPKHVVALGAAALVGASDSTAPASTRSPVAVAPTTGVDPTPDPLPRIVTAEEVDARRQRIDREPTLITATARSAAVEEDGRPRRSRRALWAVAAAMLAIIAGVGVWGLSGRDVPAVAGGDESGSALAETNATPAPSADVEPPLGDPEAGAPEPVEVAEPVVVGEADTDGRAQQSPAEPTTSCPSASGLCTSITGISVVDGRYVVDYTTDGFLPLIVGEDPDAVPGDHHVHFFFDTTQPQNAGMNGNPPGEFILWGLARGGGQLVFNEFTVDQRGAAQQMCVVVADENHAVLADAAATGNCVPLPA